MALTSCCTRKLTRCLANVLISLHLMARGQTRDFDKVAYTLTLEGDTFQFLDLLNSVETHSRFIAVPNFKLSSASRSSIEDRGFARHKLQVDLETYKFEPRTLVKQVGIEGYDRKRDLLPTEWQEYLDSLSTA